MKLRLLSILCFVAVLVSALPVAAQMGEDDPTMERPTLGKKAEEIHKKNLQTYTNTADTLVLPGLVAKRKEKRVEVLAESTSIAANDAGEYLLVGQHSSHGYEALFWSFAEPSDIHKALEFIGLRAGSPRDPRQHRYRAKGEKVAVYVGDEPGAPRIEELIYDTESEQTLPEDGLIFTGSMVIPSPTGGAERVYVADTYDPRSIIPSYNEPASVLDVPWQASKGQFYESYVMNEDYHLKANQLYTLVFEPVDKDGRPTIRDLVLKVDDKMEFELTDKGGDKLLNTNGTFDAVLVACREIIDGKQEPYVTVKLSDSLKLFQLRALAAALMMVDRPGALQIEPGPEDRLYYRAFLANPEWRDPKNRWNQAWEIHISKKKGKLTSRMVFYETSWKDGATKADLTKREFETPKPADIRKRLDKDRKEREEASKRQPPSVLLIFAPHDLRYGQLLSYIGPALKTHNIVHLFLEGDRADGAALPQKEK